MTLWHVDGRLEKLGGSQRAQQRLTSAAAGNREVRQAKAVVGGRKQDVGGPTRGKSGEQLSEMWCRYSA